MVLFDGLPLWAIFILTIAIALLAVEVGFRVGLWLKVRYPSMGESRMVSPLIAAMMGLLAFLLALTFSAAVGQHNERRELVVTEANAIGTAFLRAGFLNESAVDTSRNLLREYVEVRLAPRTDPTLIDSALARSGEIHARLWDVVEDTVQSGKESATMALYANAINSVIDVHTLRTTAGGRRLPAGLVLVLYFTYALSFLLLGIASSDDGKRIPPLSLILFTMVFVATMILILDLNRPQSGLVTVSQQALEDLLRSMTP